MGRPSVTLACGSANPLLAWLGFAILSARWEQASRGTGVSLFLARSSSSTAGYPLCKLAQMSKESILHWSLELPALSHRISAFRFLQACLLCKHLSRGSAVMTAFCASGHILTLPKSSCHCLPPCCRGDLSIGMEIMARQLLSENKMQIYDTVSII